MGAGTERDGARTWREIHDNLSKQRQHPSPPAYPAVAHRTQSRAEPKPPPLPRSDYKIILRVRGGLNCAGIHACILRQVILKAAGLPITDRTSSDQIRVNTINNTVLISTPDMERADLYHNIQSLQFNGNPYEVATHVADPIDTCRGCIHLPPDYSEDDIASTLRRCNPTLIIGGARRLGNTETIMVIFQGKIIPFYVNYDGCSLRCRPFRQKVEACTRCRGIGHRQDVCTSATDTLCPKCGMKDAPMDHECDPICVVCNGNHQTGSSLCKQRFKPRPTRPRHKQDTSPTNRTPSLDRTRDSSRRRSRSKSKDRGPGYATQDVAWPALSSSPTLANSSRNPPQDVEKKHAQSLPQTQGL
ncbi:uncharacterized protein [Dermacentor albipictus]|uniref:uncharacterized protein n=1 Tax=Dermacentor albipictus TaxID=60249 RepID=UPI0038FC31A8